MLRNMLGKNMLKKLLKRKRKNMVVLEPNKHLKKVLEVQHLEKHFLEVTGNLVMFLKSTGGQEQVLILIWEINVFTILYYSDIKKNTPISEIY